MDRAIGKPWLAITTDNVLTSINSLLSNLVFGYWLLVFGMEKVGQALF
jgi:hypothetical protein